MPDDIIQEIKIRADGGQAKREAAEVEKRFGKMFDASAMKAALFNQALSVGISAIHRINAGIKEGIKQANFYYKTTNQLSIALRTAGDAEGHWLGAMQRRNAALQSLTGVSDDTIRQLQAMAVSSGVSKDRVDDLIKASISLSNAFGMDLNSAAKNLIKTTAGLTGELGEAVPWIRDLSKEELEAGDAIDLVNEKLGDQLTTLTEGALGTTTGLNNAWDNLTESIGKAITQSESFQRTSAATTSSLSAMARVIERNGLMAGVGAGLDIAFGSGGETLQELLDSYDRLDQRFQESLDRINKANEFDFSDKGGVNAGDILERKKRKKREPRERDTTLDFGADELSDDVVFGPDGNMYTQANWDKMEELSQQAADGMSEIWETNQERRNELLEMGTEYYAKKKEEEAKIAKEAAEAERRAVQEGVDYAAQAANVALGAFNSYLEDVINGSENAGQKFAASMLKGVGQMLQGKGMAHLAEAAAMAFIPGLQGNSAGLAAAGAAEIALGTAMMAGGIALTPQDAGGGGGAPPGGGAGDFHGGFSSPSTREQEKQEQPITIILQGPVYDGASAGRAISEKLAEAKRQGLIE